MNREALLFRIPNKKIKGKKSQVTAKKKTPKIVTPDEIKQDPRYLFLGEIPYQAHEFDCKVGDTTASVVNSVATAQIDVKRQAYLWAVLLDAQFMPTVFPGMTCRIGGHTFGSHIGNIVSPRGRDIWDHLYGLAVLRFIMGGVANQEIHWQSIAIPNVVPLISKVSSEYNLFFSRFPNEPTSTSQKRPLDGKSEVTSRKKRTSPLFPGSSLPTDIQKIVADINGQ